MSQAIPAHQNVQARPAPNCADRILPRFVAYTSFVHPIISRLVQRLTPRRELYRVASPTVAPMPSRLRRREIPLKTKHDGKRPIPLRIQDNDDRDAITRMRLLLATSNAVSASEHIYDHIITVEKFGSEVYKITQQFTPDFTAFLNANGDGYDKKTQQFSDHAPLKVNANHSAAIQRMWFRIGSQNTNKAIEDLGIYTITLEELNDDLYKITLQAKPSFTAFINSHGHLCNERGEVELT